MQTKTDALPPTPLKISDLMAAARISESTARRWVRTGKIKSVRIGKTILIPRSSLPTLLGPEAGA